jgi:hypothetical protein
VTSIGKTGLELQSTVKAAVTTTPLNPCFSLSHGTPRMNVNALQFNGTYTIDIKYSSSVTERRAYLLQEIDNTEFLLENWKILCPASPHLFIVYQDVTNLQTK